MSDIPNEQQGRDALLARLDRITEGVPWTQPLVCRLLFSLGIYLQASTILEVSCGFGKTTPYLAAVASETKGTVYAVDNTRPTHNGRTVEDLLSAAGVDAFCEIRLDSDARWFLLDLFGKNPQLKLDLAYIDCTHTVEVDAFVALCAWVHLRPGGLLVFDDLDWVPAYHGSSADIYSRPDVKHVRALYDYIRSLPDVDDVCEWGEDEFEWPWGFVRKAGADSSGGRPLLPLITGLAKEERWRP
jgi:predicted O-methyltransferase YrrM